MRGCRAALCRRTLSSPPAPAGRDRPQRALQPDGQPPGPTVARGPSVSQGRHTKRFDPYSSSSLSCSVSGIPWTHGRRVPSSLTAKPSTRSSGSPIAVYDYCHTDGGHAQGHFTSLRSCPPQWSRGLHARAPRLRARRWCADAGRPTRFKPSSPWPFTYRSAGAPPLDLQRDGAALPIARAILMHPASMTPHCPGDLARPSQTQTWLGEHRRREPQRPVMRYETGLPSSVIRECERNLVGN